MKSWRRALGFGFLAWLSPFVVAFLVFPFRESARPLFESIMAVTVTATAVVLGLTYLSIPAVTWGLGLARAAGSGPGVHSESGAKP